MTPTMKPCARCANLIAEEGNDFCGDLCGDLELRLKRCEQMLYTAIFSKRTGAWHRNEVKAAAYLRKYVTGTGTGQ